MKVIPTQCPSCSGELAVTGLICQRCETRVSGHYRLPPLLKLDGDDQAFVLAFILESGSLKAMAARLGVSYPTVRNRLDQIITQLQADAAAET